MYMVRMSVQENISGTLKKETEEAPHKMMALLPVPVSIQTQVHIHELVVLTVCGACSASLELYKLDTEGLLWRHLHRGL